MDNGIKSIKIIFCKFCYISLRKIRGLGKLAFFFLALEWLNNLDKNSMKVNLKKYNLKGHIYKSTFS